MRTRLKQGSNQFKSKPVVRTRAILLSLPVALAIVALSDIAWAIWKLKRIEWILFVFIFTLVAAYQTFPFFAIAPTAQAMTEPYQLRNEYQAPTLNPNITERNQNIELIKRIWGKDSQIGLEIAKCESGYRTHAENKNTNHTLDQGVFQINSVHNMPEMEVAVANISYAYLMFQQQGTNPWTSSEHCWK